MSERLFVYGTLHPARAPAEIADAVGELQSLGPGTVRGRLYLLEGYPGLVLDEEANAVAGEIFEVPSVALWSRLDSYEGYHPDDEAGSLFVRRRAKIATSGGSVLDCWIYEYNGPLPKNG